MIGTIHHEFHASCYSNKLANDELITHKVIMIGNMFFKRFWSILTIIIIRVIAHNNIWSSDYAFDIAKRFKLRIWINWIDLFLHATLPPHNSMSNQFL